MPEVPQLSELPFGVDEVDDPDRLPIEKYRDDILGHLQWHGITFIQGDTGCGKSSMVPQYIVQNDPNARVIITQPRRLAAISLAKRVGEQLGNPDLVGWRLGGGDKQVSTENVITFTTAGYLVQLLAFNQDALKPFTHIILDEVHERTLDSDLLLLLVKFTMIRWRNVRLVVMTATMQSALFAEYFAQFEPDIMPLVVGGKRFPVQSLFLNELPFVDGMRLERLPSYQAALDNQRADYPMLGKPMQQFICELIEVFEKPGQAILVFLPGVAEIELLQANLQNRPGRVPRQILPLHSLLPTADQDLAVQPTMEGHCKIVLTTNIAESSITIPDAHLVIDSCLRRGVFVDERTEKPALLTRWISQASVKQRAGRTGRVAPGTVIHLVTRDFYRDHMDEHAQSEMSHASLDKAILIAKLLLPRYGTVRRLMSLAPTPPSPTRVQATVEELYKYGALTSNKELAGVTAVGRLAVRLPLELPLVRLVLFGQAMGCLPQAVVMAACLEQGDLFPMPSRMFSRDHTRFARSLANNFADRVLMDDGQGSEALSSLGLYAAWLDRKACAIVPPRARTVDHMVADICRTILAEDVLNLDPGACNDLRLLEAMAGGRVRRTVENLAGALLLRPKQQLPLYFVLAAAGTPNFLRASVKPEAGQRAAALAAARRLDPARTVLLKGVPDELTSGAQLGRVLAYPNCRPVVTEIVDGEGLGWKDALVELAPAQLRPRSRLGLGGIRDVDVASKLLFQLFLHNRRKLPLSAPLAEAGGVEELELTGFELPYDIKWELAGTRPGPRSTWDAPPVTTARCNSRSPLASVSDLDAADPNWNPPVAVALSLLGTSRTSEVFASGVTIMPSGFFGSLMMVLLLAVRLTPSLTPWPAHSQL